MWMFLCVIASVCGVTWYRYGRERELDLATILQKTRHENTKTRGSYEIISQKDNNGIVE